MGSIPVSGTFPGGRHVNPLQYFCLENPMDRGAWQAVVLEVTELDMTEAPEYAGTHVHTVFEASLLSVTKSFKLQEILFQKTWDAGRARNTCNKRRKPLWTPGVKEDRVIFSSMRYVSMVPYPFVDWYYLPSMTLKWWEHRNKRIPWPQKCVKIRLLRTRVDFDLHPPDPFLFIRVLSLTQTSSQTSGYCLLLSLYSQFFSLSDSRHVPQAAHAGCPSGCPRSTSHSACPRWSPRCPPSLTAQLMAPSEGWMPAESSLSLMPCLSFMLAL